MSKQYLSKLENIGQQLRRLREKAGQPLRTVAAHLDIDQAILSKIERGKRKAKREDILKLAEYFCVDREELLINWLASEIVYDLRDEDLANKVIKLAEDQLVYFSAPKIKVDTLKTHIRKELGKYPQVSQAWIFGSFARGEESAESDIDIMINVPHRENFSMFDVFQIQENLQNTLNRKCDVVLSGALKPFAWETAKKELKLVYDKSGKEK